MTAEDHATALRLWHECGLSNEPEDGSDPVTELLSLPQSAGFVAESAGKIIGVVLCGNDGRYGYIHHLAVGKSLRRTGTGRALVGACMSFLKRRHVAVMVRDNNKLAQKFWSGLGFEKVTGLSVLSIDAGGPRR